MSSPRFEPRRYVSVPQDFGRYAGVGWRQTRSAEDRDRSEAAKMQHMYAVIIRMRARRKFKTVRGYADACGVSYDRMAKMLRGEAIMRFEDVAQAERILGNIHKDALLAMSMSVAA